MLDIDTLAVVDALDEARRMSGLDQGAFARALSTSPSRYSTYRSGGTAPSAAFLMRARRIATGLRRATELGVASSLTAAASIEAALDAKGEDWAFALVLEARDRLADTFSFRPDTLAAWEAAPTMRDARWGAFLAAIVAHAFEAHGQVPPRWTQRHAELPVDWFPVESIRLAPEEVRRTTPAWLSSRRIFVAERDMITA